MMTERRKDGRAFTNSNRQKQLFEQLLRLVDGLPVQVYSPNTLKDLSRLYESYENGLLTKKQIIAKVQCTNGQQTLYGNIDGQPDLFKFDFVQNGDVITAKNPKFRGLQKSERFYYLLLPRDAQRHLPQIFSAGVRSKSYGGTFMSDPILKNKDLCSLKFACKQSDLARLDMNQIFDDEIFEAGYYFKSDIITPERICSLRYVKR